MIWIISSFGVCDPKDSGSCIQCCHKASLRFKNRKVSDFQPKIYLEIDKSVDIEQRSDFCNAYGLLFHGFMNCCSIRLPNTAKFGQYEAMVLVNDWNIRRDGHELTCQIHQYSINLHLPRQGHRLQASILLNDDILTTMKSNK